MGVAYDSRRVTPGMVFVAVPGLKADGLQFVPQAIAAGAAAIVTEQPATGVPVHGWSSRPPGWHWRCSRRSFEHPSRAMRVVGITGTNGKTTTSYLTAAILEAAGVRCGMMGTVIYRIGTRSIDATRTTPEAPETAVLHAPDGDGRLRRVRDGSVVARLSRCGAPTGFSSPRAPSRT